MKKLMRFMGNSELSAFLAGRELENHTDWSKRSKGTKSKGFCFFDLSEPPEERLKYLIGVVDRSFIAEFEVADDVELRESSGRYAIPGHGYVYPQPMQNKKEYSIEQYSSKTFTIERFGMPEILSISDDGELKFGIYWLWDDSEMTLSDWLDTLNEEHAIKEAEKIFRWIRGGGR